MGRPVSQPFADRLTPAYLGLLATVKSPHERAQLRGFFGFLADRAVLPPDASSQHLIQYGEALSRLPKAPKRLRQAQNDAARAWNHQVDRTPGWPRQRLEVPPSSHARLGAFPHVQLPESFHLDLESYLHATGKDGLFEPLIRRPTSPVTLADRRRKILLLASKLVGTGTPPAGITSLAALTTESAARAILECIWNEYGAAPNAHAANLARALLLIAKHHTEPGDAVIRLISAVEKRMRVPQLGMTQKNRGRLRVITTQENLPRLVGLPEQVYSQVDIGRPTVSAALDLQLALAVDILLQTAMRARNLCNLALDIHFSHLESSPVQINILAHEVKNRLELRYELRPKTVEMLSVYVRNYRPLLLKGKKSEAVFLSLNGRKKGPDQLGTQITKFIRDRAGLEVNPHLFRHLAGYLFLREHPGEYETVRQLLGHKSLLTTVRFYVGLEHDHAFRRYDQVMERHRQDGGHHSAA